MGQLRTCRYIPPKITANNRKPISKRLTPVNTTSSSSESLASTLPSCVGIVKTSSCEVYVIGTVHTACKSAEQVQRLMSHVRPDVVVLELDQERLDDVIFKRLPNVQAELASGGATDSASELASVPKLSAFLPWFRRRGAIRLQEEGPGGLLLSLGMSFFYSWSSALTGKRIGEEFAAALTEAERLGAVVVLGDSKARDVLTQLGSALAGAFTSPQQLFDAGKILRAVSYTSSVLGPWKSLPHGEGLSDATEISLREAMLEDPAKLSPLLVTVLFSTLAGVSTTLLLEVASFAFQQAAAVPTAASAPPSLVVEGMLGTACTIGGNAALLWVGLACWARAVEAVLQQRDEILTHNVQRSLELAKSLEKGDLSRIRYRFSTSPDVTGAELECRVSNEGGHQGIPLFTLKRPLEEGEVRTLNLFEPRWLRLLDSLKEANGGSMEGAEFVTFVAPNRIYMPTSEIQETADVAADAGQLRLCDQVVHNQGRRVRIVRADEGKRQVTNRRIVRIWIEGCGIVKLRSGASSLHVHPGGYLLADLVDEPLVARTGMLDVETHNPCADGEDDCIRCLCVVGLAHCNGVVRRLVNVLD
ncbi:hypothetical protein CYMTET_2965 [Cymbomonas tetramitiformis]|uniref:TraB domain-containing protein n=1 Tax=Cymbomonas tetramitiformis TaxID=36881 RepID=A0AAE0H460_9CHLO|nr:hypothetical protein CYMTET_2965 [Cymbomonas tetramitiformis]